MKWHDFLDGFAVEEPGPMQNLKLFLKTEAGASSGLLRPGLEEGADYEYTTATEWQLARFLFACDAAILRRSEKIDSGMDVYEPFDKLLGWATTHPELGFEKLQEAERRVSSAKLLMEAERKKLGLDGKNDEEENMEETGPDNLCVVCYTNTKEYAFSACGHLCLCAVCEPSVNQCPICRGGSLFFNQKIRIYS